MMKTLREQVTEFHLAMGQPVRTVPSLIVEERVRLRAALIAEEAFEVLEALLDVRGNPTNASVEFRTLKFATMRAIQTTPVDVNMADLADGLADLDYVVEGARVEFGIDGGPIAAEVHRANMTKVGGPMAPNGKRLKPPGWQPPDVEAELVKQGWERTGP
jgi:predicted HAD superfamily Cof-like phosphohydrolase